MTTVERHSAGTICWFDLMTPEPEQARAFYQGLFGWTYEIGGEESGHYTMCLLRGRRVAGMSPLPDAVTFPSSWSVYFAVDDADAAIARVREHRGQVLMGPTDVLEEGRVVFCLDPSGGSFGMWQARNHAGAGVIDEPGAMAWAEVNTRATIPARDFYAQAFGLEARKLDGAPTEHWILQRGDRRVGGVVHMSEQWPADTAPHWIPYFTVAEIDAATTRARQLGATIAAPPLDTPSGRVAVIHDPWSAAFSIVQLSSSA